MDIRLNWNDGAQMIAPHDKNTIDEVNKITSVKDVKFRGNAELIEIIGEEIDRRYLDRIKTLSLSPEAIAHHHDMKIVYTPIHGTGVKLIPASLKKLRIHQHHSRSRTRCCKWRFSDCRFSQSRRTCGSRYGY